MNDPRLLAVAERLRQARDKAGLTAQEAADRSHLSLSSLSMYERGATECRITTLSRLADVYGCSADFLLGRIDEHDQHASLPRGWVMVDNAIVRGILAATTDEQIDRLTTYPPHVISWAWPVPQDFSLYSAADYAPVCAEVDEHIDRHHPKLEERWLNRLKDAHTFLGPMFGPMRRWIQRKR